MSSPLPSQSSTSFKHGDVLSYLPERHHCRETTAFVTERGVALDTYWRPTGDGDSHRLTSDELATATVRFNVNDYDALDVYSRSSRSTWETYHPDDRERIPSQHGYQEALFIRRGAKPDLSTQIENARSRLQTAESGLRIAESRVEWCKRDLAELEKVHAT